ncbi:MAG: hypothetical protein QOG56_1332 [Solirubrobacteraceae bacterium]|jgi:uncharacterized membrane protein|nr:hypothetical protein [Solirubrobacteraceae bacterium]
MSAVTAVSKNGGGGPKDPVARGLGAFSFALGVPQITSPGRVNRMIGVRDDARNRMWMRVVGAREIVAGVGIFSERLPKEWVWARVAGDTMDLALLAAALRGKSPHPTRTLAATGAVIGAFAADVYDGVRLTRDAADEPETGAEPVQIAATITVRRDREECYAYWRDFERFPSFMAHLEEVHATHGERSHWKARGPLGMTVAWDAQVTEDVPGERISWSSVEGSKVDNSGSVRFVAAPADQGTEIHLELRYAPPAGAFGATFAKILGEEPAIQCKDDLRRFKQILETGEIARSDGSPEGQLGLRQVKQRPAQPVAAEELDSVDDAGAS